MKHVVDYLSVLCFALLYAWHWHRCEATPLQFGMVAPFACALADLCSGVAHWAFDTFGTPTTPVFGTFIHSFREHHDYPHRITQHSFVETNGDNMLACIPLLVLAPLRPAWLHAFSLVLILMVALTNQFHAWAHELHPPYVVRLLQNAGLILPRAHHQRHHWGEHNSHYTITNGWLNNLLDHDWNLWRRLESLLL